VNSAGQIVGVFLTSTGDHSFLYFRNTRWVDRDQHSFITIDAPGASATRASGINNAGQIVGVLENSTGIHGFLYTRGKFTMIDVPGAEYTEAYGINNAGQIVGFSATSTVVSGFVYTNGSFATFEVPGSDESTTIPISINDTGQIVGTYELTTGTGIGSITTAYGFLATPVTAIFAGMPGKPSCIGKSVSALARQFGGLNNAALGHPSVRALEQAIMEFCEA
jgi:probable HAF family extracellular repeat protein